MSDHIDLYVVNGDFSFDDLGVNQFVSQRQSIGQDIKHRLIESGLVLALVAIRSAIERQAIINKILIEVDKDQRLEPGTAQLKQGVVTGLYDAVGVYVLTAKTIEYGDVRIEL